MINRGPNEIDVQLCFLKVASDDSHQLHKQDSIETLPENGYAVVAA